MNGGYHANLENIMTDDVKLFVHGHTHSNFDYMVGNTRVVCNPRGYAKYEENKDFDPGLILEV